MDPNWYWLAASGYFTSMLTAVAGMGGGVVLMALMLIPFSPAVVLPFHGAVQLVSNSSRVVLFWKHHEWRLIWRFAALLLPGAWAGLTLFQGLPERVILLCIALAIFGSLWLKGRRFWPEAGTPLWGFWVLGFLGGALGMLVGAIGYLFAAFVVRKDLSRLQVVGTLGVFSALGHLAKIVIFGAAGFDFAAYWQPFLLMLPAMVLGTITGKYLLGRVSEIFFTRLYVGVLLVLGSKLLLWDVWLKP